MISVVPRWYILYFSLSNTPADRMSVMPEIRFYPRPVSLDHIYHCFPMVNICLPISPFSQSTASQLKWCDPFSSRDSLATPDTDFSDGRKV